MTPLIDHLLHGVDIVAMLAMLFAAVRLVNRLESVLKDYPPHRHINGSIVYPNDFQPGKVGSMTASAGQ